MKKLSSRPVSFQALAIIAVFVGFLRALFEYQFFGAGITIQVLWFMPYFYFSIGLVLFVLFHSVVGIDWRRSFGAVAMGVALGVFPPLIDLAVSGAGANIRYSYNFFIQPETYPWLFFGGAAGIPIGECASLWMSVVFAGLYAFYVRRSVWRALLISVILYVFFHIYLSGLPIFTAYLLLGKFPDTSMALSSAGHVINAITYFFAFWYIGIALFAYGILRPILAKLLVKRILHILPFCIIAFFGSMISAQPVTEAVLNSICIALVFYICAVENDYFDNLYTGGSRATVNKQDIAFLRIILLMTVAWLIMLGKLVGLFYLLIYLGAVIYQLPQYRARKYFAAGMKIEGLWGWLSFTSGTLITIPKKYQPALLLYGLLIFLGWSLISVLKDLKDLNSDRRAGNESIYLYFRKFGVSLRTSHRFVSFFVFAGMLIPAVVMLLRGGYAGAIALSLLDGMLLLTLMRRRWFIRFKLQLAIICVYLGALLYWQSALP